MDLMDRLEKTAANKLNELKEVGSKAIGTDYRKVREAWELQNSPEAIEAAYNAGVDVSRFRRGLENLEGTLAKEKQTMDEARSKVKAGAIQAGKATGIAGAGAAAGVAGTKLHDRREEKQANELYESLEKTAANALGAIKNFGNKASGKDYRQAKNTFDLQRTPQALEKAKGAGVDISKYHQNLENLEANVAKEKSSMKKNLAGAAVGTAGVTGAGVAAAKSRNNEEEKQANELYESLEKTAANALGAIKNFGNKASGKDYRQAKNTFDLQRTPQALEKAKGAGVDISKYHDNLKNLEGNVAKEKSSMKKSLAGAAAGTAGVAGAGAAAAKALDKKEDKEEKTASESFMNDLYKEAAAHIFESNAPEVKAHVDPMDRISFKR